MTDLETYECWSKLSYELYARVDMGKISKSEADRLVATMESHLGMNKWSDDQWLAAQR